MVKTKKCPAEKEQGYENGSNDSNGITIEAQRKRLLDWLSNKPITTLQARTELNILSPAARIFELRHNCGYEIVTHWITDCDTAGRRHRVAKYFLVLDINRGGEA